LSRKVWAKSVKRYYTDVERYDWVDVTDHLKGIESIFHWNRVRVILRLLSKYCEGPPIIDVGCGTGLILRNLQPLSVGLDINRWALEQAKKHAPREELVIADAENIPFRDSSFSTVVCTEMIEHVPNPEVALWEIFRLLKKKGRLIGSVPHKSSFWRFRVLSSTCPHEEPFHNQYGIDEVKELLSSFKIIYLKISTLRLNVVFIGEKNSNP
jgi:ubiquinone/menaquinone biosynthesis C-methylase UbiE